MNPRTQMFSDVVIGAVEGGTGYWAQVARYKWDVDDRIPATAELIEVGPDGRHFTLDSVQVANAMYRIMYDHRDLSVADRHREAIALALVKPDEADLDADDCDVIAQVAMFGEIVYG